MVRKNGMRGEDGMVPVAWEELLDGVATKLLEIRGKYGPQSIAFLGSTKCTNEENYLFQKIARVLLKTNNLDNGGYLCGRSALQHLDSRTGGQWRTRPLAALEKAEAIFVLGADPGHSAPVVGYYLKRAAQRGVPMLVANSCPTELENFSTIGFNLALNGTSGKGYLELLNGLAALLVKKKGHNTSFIKQFSKGFKQYREGLSAVDLERICRVTGIDISVLDAAAELIKGKKIAFVIGNGILLGRHGMQSIDAVVNLALMTGSLGSTGAGIHVIAAENNLIGAWDMGTVPDALPGRRFLDEKSAQKHFEKAWQAEISADEGFNVVGMIEAAEKGTLKALYVLGENPLRSLPQPDRVRQALDNLDFIVVQDIIISETAKMADALLPGAAFSEKGGSFTNLEGKIQSFDPVVPPPGDARPDWKILSRLAANLGDNTPYNSLGDIVDEIRRLVPMYGDLNKGRHSAWVKVADRQAGKKTPGNKYRISFSLLAPSVNQEDAEPPVQTYPLTAIIGSRRYHLGSGTRTGCSDRISAFGLKGEIEISVKDAAKLDLTEGDTVSVLSLHGELKREIKLNNRLQAGQIFIPIAFDNNAAMNLIEMTRLDIPDSPGWKTCRVKLEKI
jgi:predicted molibdopterin-dependent oxidoreductase YjgC